MPMFRKKPVEIEAHQWFRNGDHPDDYTSVPQYYDTIVMMQLMIEGRVVRRFNRPDVAGEESCEVCGLPYHKHGFLDMFDDKNPIVCPGDWIITCSIADSDHKMYYSSRRSVFESTYEPVENSQEKT
jgi:hypothetical protein